jgi:GntR family transcriptional regulator
VPAVPMSYIEIAEDIAARIRAGEYQPGDRLPRTKELAELYSVSDTTAYRAVSLLRFQGVVVGSQGRGVFVATDTGKRE